MKKYANIEHQILALSELIQSKTDYEAYEYDNLFQQALNEISNSQLKSKTKERTDILYHNAIHLMELPHGINIFKDLSLQLEKITPNAVIAISSLHKHKKYVKLEAVAGLSSEELRMARLLNIDINLLKFPISPEKSPEIFNELRSPSLIVSKHGVLNLKNLGFSKKWVQFLLNRLVQNKVYTCGIHHNQELIGNISIIPRHGNDLKNKKLLETIISQYAVAIQKEKTTQALIASEEQYRGIFENSNIGIYRSSFDGVILMANPALLKMLKFSSIEHLTQFYTEQNTYKTLGTRQKFLEELLRDQKVTGFESEWLSANGKSIWIREKARIIKDKEGNNLFIEGTAEDITEKKQMEEELISSKEKAVESDRLKSAFLANMSHEIRTPMNAIIGFAQLLDRKNINEEKKNKYVGQINTNARLLLGLINDILDISKIEAGQLSIYPEAFHLNDTLKKIHSQLNHELNLLKKEHIKTEFKYGIGDDNSFIIADEIRIKQILNNLINNAIKFTATGFIKFSYEVTTKKELHFCVSDSGIGISKENQEQIFNRFNQVDYAKNRSFGGTGLGLSISKALCEMMGGKLWVKSAIDKGSEFHFTIPLHFSPIKTKRHDFTNDFSYPNFENKTILIVEDTSSAFEFLKDLLSPTKASIYRAINSRTTLEFIDKLHRIDLLLLDLRLPDISGMEIVKEIRKRKKHLPIIAQTAYAFEEDKQKALAAGFNDYIIKPIEKDSLFAILEKHLLK